MSSQPRHRREDNKICGSEKNHHKTWEPKDTAGSTWQKEGKTCMPSYLNKDRDYKIKRTMDDIDKTFRDQKKMWQCFPKKKWSHWQNTEQAIWQENIHPAPCLICLLIWVQDTDQEFYIGWHSGGSWIIFWAECLTNCLLPTFKILINVGVSQCLLFMEC